MSFFDNNAARLFFLIVTNLSFSRNYSLLKILHNLKIFTDMIQNFQEVCNCWNTRILIFILRHAFVCPLLDRHCGQLLKRKLVSTGTVKWLKIHKKTWESWWNMRVLKYSYFKQFLIGSKLAFKLSSEMNLCQNFALSNPLLLVELNYHFVHNWNILKWKFKF